MYVPEVSEIPLGGVLDAPGITKGNLLHNMEYDLRGLGVMRQGRRPVQARRERSIKIFSQYEIIMASC